MSVMLVIFCLAGWDWKNMRANTIFRASKGSIFEILWSYCVEGGGCVGNTHWRLLSLNPLGQYACAYVHICSIYYDVVDCANYIKRYVFSSWIHLLIIRKVHSLISEKEILFAQISKTNVPNHDPEHCSTKESMLRIVFGTFFGRLERNLKTF